LRGARWRRDERYFQSETDLFRRRSRSAKPIGRIGHGHRQFESSTAGEAIRISELACQCFFDRTSSGKDKPIRAARTTMSNSRSTPKYKHVKMERRDGILQFTLHTNGGPVIWDFQAHSDTAHALGDVAETETTRS